MWLCVFVEWNRFPCVVYIPIHGIGVHSIVMMIYLLSKEIPNQTQHFANKSVYHVKNMQIIIQRERKKRASRKTTRYKERERAIQTERKWKSERKNERKFNTFEISVLVFDEHVCECTTFPHACSFAWHFKESQINRERKKDKNRPNHIWNCV